MVRRGACLILRLLARRRGRRNDLDHRADRPLSRPALPADMLHCYILGMKVCRSLRRSPCARPGSGRTRRRWQDRRGGGGEFLWRYRAPDRGYPSRRPQHHEQPRSGPASVRDHAGHRAANRGRAIAIVNGADYDPWMEKLLSAVPQPTARSSLPPTSCTERPATIRISGTTPPPCRRSPRRSPRYERRRCGACERLRGAARQFPRLAQAAQRQDRRHPRQTCWRRRHRQRAGVAIWRKRWA